MAGGCGVSISGWENCTGLKAGEVVSPKTVRKKQNPKPKNNREIKRTAVSSEAAAASGAGETGPGSLGPEPRPRLLLTDGLGLRSGSTTRASQVLGTGAGVGFTMDRGLSGPSRMETKGSEKMRGPRNLVT